MAWIAALVGGAVSLYGSSEAQRAAGNAQKEQSNATAMSTAEAARQFNIGQNNLYPWLQSGRNALKEQNALMGLGGDSQGALRSLQSSPNYQFQLQQGQRGLDASLAGKGGMGSGKAMTAASNWNQNYASGAFGTRLNQLSNMSGVGQSTAGTMANLGQNQTNTLGSLWTNQANANAASGIASSNARLSSLLGGANLGLDIYKYRNQ